MHLLVSEQYGFQYARCDDKNYFSTVVKNGILLSVIQSFSKHGTKYA
jgi:hypothetical protein